MSKTQFAAAVAGLGLLAALAGADVSPDAGTIGTEFSVSFDTDVGTKPKIELRYLVPTKKAKSPKAKAKLVSSDGTNVTFVIQAAKGGGAFSVGAKKSDATAGTLTLASPRVDSLGSAAVGAGGELVIQGQYFGELANKRNAPKVFVNGKKAKVTSFADDALTVRVHKKTKTGAADVRVQNKVGEDTLAGALTITAPAVPIKGGDVVSGKIGGVGYNAQDSKKQTDPSFASALASDNNVVNGFQITANHFTGGGTKFRTRALTLNNMTLPAQITQLQTPVTLTGDDAGIWGLIDTQTNLRANPPATIDMYASEGQVLSVTIDTVSDGRVAGSFSGSLTLLGGNKTIKLENMKFVLTLE